MEAIRKAAARAANRRGSNTKIFESPASINARGTSVVFPAPGGATSTAFRPAPTITRNNPGKASATGNPNPLKSIIKTHHLNVKSRVIARRAAPRQSRSVRRRNQSAKYTIPQNSIL
jgi:hypothetical protein